MVAHPEWQETNLAPAPAIAPSPYWTTYTATMVCAGQKSVNRTYRVVGDNTIVVELLKFGRLHNRVEAENYPLFNAPGDTRGSVS